MVVASELDDSTERIVNYLNDEYGAAINAVFFRFFQDGDSEYRSRVWLIDPGEAEVKMVERRGEEPWNGEYYVEDTPPTDKPEEELEYYVRVDWIKTLPLDQAIKEKGFFGNQNSVAKPKARKWVHTIERLKKRLEISE